MCTRVRTYLDGVGDGVDERGEATVADVHLRLDVQVLVAHLDGGVVDADAVHARPELEQEALVVVVGGGADEALDEGAGLAGAQPRHVHHLHRHLLLAAAAAAVGIAVPVQRQDAAPHAVERGEPLQRSPPQRLLVVLLLVLEPRRLPREHVVPATP